jgi:hemolysin activation/secretion protein
MANGQGERQGSLGTSVFVAELVVLLAFFATPCALAQQVPSTAAPTAVDRQLQTEPQPARSPEVIAIAASTGEGALPPGADIPFTLSDLQVRGITVYEKTQLLAPYLALVGQTITVGKVFEIANELTARYRADGWTFSRVVVPAQEITGGRVVLQAVEGYARSIEFVGDSGRREAYERQIKKNLEGRDPLDQESLERYLLLMNDVPGAHASAAVAPAKQGLGAVEVIASVSQERFSASFGASNRGSRVLGPEQFDASVTINGVLGGYDSTRLAYVSTGDNRELTYLGIAQTWLLSSEGTRLELIASGSDSAPDLEEDFAALNLESASKTFGVGVTHPLIRSRFLNLNFRLLANYHEGETRSDIDETARDYIPAVRLGLTFDSVGGSGVNVVDLQISQGIGIGNATLSSDMNSSRPGASAEFFKAEAYVARLQSLGRGWTALLALQGQFAANELLSSEEFAFGGPLFGRAYDASEMVGDSGAAAKLEIRYTFSGRNAEYPPVTVYGFYDAGMAYRRNPRPDEKSRDTATSAGGGLRFNIGSHVHGYLEGAVPLTQIVSAEGDDDARVFAGLTLTF